jgi:TatA/E family protein of Tat protein translocase
MFDIGGPELLVIVLGIIVLFGPKKIPEIAQMIGKGMQKVRTAQTQFNEQMKDIKSEFDKVGEPENFAKNEPIINEVKASELDSEHIASNNNPKLRRDQISTRLEFDNDESEKSEELKTHRTSEEFGFKPLEPKAIDSPYDLESQEKDDEKELTT